MPGPLRDDDRPPPPSLPLRVGGVALAALAIVAVGFVLLRIVDAADGLLSFLTRPHGKPGLSRVVAAPVDVPAPASDDEGDAPPPTPVAAAARRREPNLPDAGIPLDAGRDAGLDAPLYVDAGFDAFQRERRRRGARLDVVAEVEAHYAPVTSFKADVSQSIHVKSNGTVKRLRGSVAFAKPGQMDFAYAYPAGDRVVSNGSTLDAYEVAARRVVEESASDSPYTAAFCFLNGHVGALSAEFDFRVRGGEPGETEGGGYVLTGTPKVATTGVQRVIYDVDAATMDVTRVVILDDQGNRNTIDLSRPRLNEALDPNEFNFVPPTGVSVVRP